jgi:AcrR family transcriptional regulator
VLRKGDATRVRILDEAARQVSGRGLVGASLGDLAQAVGLSKSGLFKHFESKEAMQLAVVQRVMDQFTALVWAPAEPLPMGRARLAAIFERWLEWAENEWEQGCPLVALSVELDDRPGPLRDLMQGGQRRWSSTLAREFQALRDPRVSEDEARLAAFQMKSFILGHNDARRLLEDAGAKRAARAAFAALLDRTGRAG